MRGRARGQATVEVAALFVLFLPIVVGIVDLGRAYFAYDTLVHAVNEGARRGSFDRDSTNVVAAVQAAASTLTLASGDVAVACFGGSTSTATTCSSMVIGDTVEVSAHVVFAPLTPLVGALLPGGTLTIGAVTRRSFQ
jgi:Flp pilus assembly protein TadG